MKTKLVALTILFLASFYGAGQINRDYKNKVNLKYDGPAKLPVLELKKRNTLPKNIFSAVGRKTKPTLLKMIPKPPSSNVGVFSATFTSESIRSRYAHLVLYGKYDGKTILVENWNRRETWSAVVIKFKGLKDKIYRITLDLDADFRLPQYQSYLRYRIHEPVAGASGYQPEHVEVNISPGNNTVDFLVRPKFTADFYTTLISNNLLDRNNNRFEEDYRIKIKEVKIRQLQD